MWTRFRPFVASHAAAGGVDLRWLTAGDVTAFLTGESRRLAPKTAQRLYLDLRRGLGFKLDRDAKLLDQFITYLEQRETGTVTVTDALAWATLPANASPGFFPMSMTVVHGFAAYLATLDLAAAGTSGRPLLPSGPRRRAEPYCVPPQHRHAARPGKDSKTPVRQETIRDADRLHSSRGEGMRGGEIESRLMTRTSIPRVACC